MPSLRELQSAFSDAVFSGGEQAEQFLSWCAGDRPERGLQAYRNSVLANLAGAVRTTYPVLGRIVGPPFLNAAIRRYVLERPSTCGDLNAYGGDFADFLEGYEPATGLPYLPDVARLEWQVRWVGGLADAPLPDLSRLAATAPGEWGDLAFLIDPAHAILSSRWPLARIWEVNRSGYAGDFQVDFDAAQTVLIHRRPAGIAVECLSVGEAAFVQGLGQCASLVDAAGQAMRHVGFDLQSALQRFISNGLIRQAYSMEATDHAG